MYIRSEYKIDREFVIQSINNGSNSVQKRATDDKYNFTVTKKANKPDFWVR